MNWVDLAILAVLAISALLGLSRGLVRELLGLLSWVVAGLAAWRFHDQAVPLMLRLTGDADIADPAAYVATFIVVLIGLSLLSSLIGRLVRVSALGGLDRTLGLLFGLVRGAALLIVAYVVGGMMMPPPSWPPALRAARSLPLLYAGAEAAAARIPERYRPKVAPPPEGWSGDAASLMHASPSGSATGPAGGAPALGPGAGNP